MASATDTPVDLYIAASGDPDAARADWDGIKQFAKDDLIKVDGRIPVSRRDDGKIHVDDDFHDPQGRHLGGGRRGGHRTDLPAGVACQRGGRSGYRSGAGALVSHARKEEIKADVEDTLPPNSSGIVALFEERWEDDIDRALSNASNVTKEKVDADSAEQVKASATQN